MPETPQSPDPQHRLAAASVDLAQLEREIAAIAGELHNRALQASLAPEQIEAFKKRMGQLADVLDDFVIQVAEGKISPTRCIAEIRETMEALLPPAQT